MGNNSSEIESLSARGKTVSKSDFQFFEVIGKGGFSRVWRVKHKKTQQIFALKEMNKAKFPSLIQNYDETIGGCRSERVENAHSHKAHVHFPFFRFFVNLICAFQDRDCLYLVIDFFQGGDLRYNMTRMKKPMTEEMSKFFIACTFLALEELHKNGAMHRDLKPENLLIDEKGYLHLTDFGIARFWKPENSHETSGTPSYMAPEILMRENHGISVDYYALGIMAYEFMLQKRPYKGRTRKEIKDQILIQQVSISREMIPEDWSLESADFINSCIQRKAENRIGSQNGPEEIRNHPWFANFEWKTLEEMRFESPYLPPTGTNHMSYTEDAHKLDLADKEIQKCEKELLDNPDLQSIFMEFCKDFDFEAYETIVTSRKRNFSQSIGNANTAGTSNHNFH